MYTISFKVENSDTRNINMISDYFLFFINS